MCRTCTCPPLRCRCIASTTFQPPKVHPRASALQDMATRRQHNTQRHRSGARARASAPPMPLPGPQLHRDAPVPTGLNAYMPAQHQQHQHQHHHAQQRVARGGSLPPPPPLPPPVPAGPRQPPPGAPVVALGLVPGQLLHTVVRGLLETKFSKGRILLVSEAEGRNKALALHASCRKIASFSSTVRLIWLPILGSCIACSYQDKTLNGFS